MKSIGRFLSAAAKVASLTALASYIVFALMYVMPLTPLSAWMGPVLSTTIGNFFPQNWSLFAPNPVSENQALLVRCLDHTEAAAAAAGSLPAGGWSDLTTPVIERYQQRRFAAYERVHRPTANAIRTYLSGGTDLKPLMDACVKGDKPSCETAEKVGRPRVEQAGKMLARIASSFCLGQPEALATEQVALRVRRTPGVLWSDRYNAEQPQSEDLDFGTYPIVRDVPVSGLYGNGGTP